MPKTTLDHASDYERRELFDSAQRNVKQLRLLTRRHDAMAQPKKKTKKKKKGRT